MKMTHSRTNKVHKRRQQGGMKFSREIKQHLLAKGMSEVDIIAFLVSSATQCNKTETQLNPYYEI